MEITFAPKGILQIDDARIIYRNFAGIGGKYNREGDRNFSIVIPTQEIAEALCNDKNEYGVSWNVKIKPPMDDQDEPFIFLPVKLKFNGRGPAVYLDTNGKLNRLDEGSVALLDDCDIARVDLDVRPYDDEINGKPFRAAYVQSMKVTQNVDRFAGDGCPEE